MTAEQTDHLPLATLSLRQRSLGPPSVAALSLSDDSLDVAALTRLVALAGPVDGPELMRRLIVDLGSVLTGITTAFANQDRALMLRHSHVLLGIAGAIGAKSIYQLAQYLNACAKDDTGMDAAPQSTELPQRLMALIQHLHLLSAQMGMT